ncbi:Ubiquitin carboxyl-terminal hydrolase family protein, partial [Reticulomyxa filosa]
MAEAEVKDVKNDNKTDDSEQNVEKLTTSGSIVMATKRNKFVGLLNQRATCYLNSLLQSMYFTPELRRGLYELPEDELGVAYLQETEELEKKIANGEIQTKEEDVASLMASGFSAPRVTSCANTCLFFDAKANNDVKKAEELLKSGKVPSVKKVIIQLRQLFAQLQNGDADSVSTKEITKSFGWLNKEATVQHDAHELNRILLDAIERSINDTNQKTLVNDIYQGQTIHRTLCLECSQVSITKETFLDIMVEVQN